MAQNAETDTLFHEDADSLVSKAIHKLQSIYPAICHPENGFNTEAFDLITLEKIGGDARVTFDHIFTVIPLENIPSVYRLTVDLQSGNSSISILPEGDYSAFGGEAISFYKTDESVMHLVVKALLKLPKELPTEEQIKILLSGKWIITEEEEFYNVVIDTQDGSSWLKIDKQSLRVYDENHKHLPPSEYQQEFRILKRKLQIGR